MGSSLTPSFLALAAQVIFFVILGPLADYGNWSSFLFKASTAAGCVCLGLVCVTADMPCEVPGALFCAGNVCYGVAQVFYNGRRKRWRNFQP